VSFFSIGTTALPNNHGMPRFDVTIAGELNLDLILYGVPGELVPERELLADGMTLTLGSSSAIVAHNLAALGARVGFVSCVGNDSLGEIALDRLKQGGVDVSQVRKKDGAKTTGLTLILQHGKWRNIITYPGTIFDLTVDDLDLSYLADARHFHLSSFYLQRGLRGGILGLFQKMKSAGLTTSLDPNDDPDDTWDGDLREILQLVDVFLPNAREAKKIAGADDLEIAISRLSQMVPILVVKRGADGALALRGSERFSSPALRLGVIDPVGAGDSFDAGFLSQYVRGADLPSCLAMGNLAGGFSTTRPGGTEAFRDRAYREQFFRSQQER
jgi:sugar/nucleoside kinase (ribokinase family)